jgi:hypothetical protein
MISDTSLPAEVTSSAVATSELPSSNEFALEAFSGDASEVSSAELFLTCIVFRRVYVCVRIRIRSSSRRVIFNHDITNGNGLFFHAVIVNVHQSAALDTF